MTGWRWPRTGTRVWAGRSARVLRRAKGSRVSARAATGSRSNASRSELALVSACSCDRVGCPAPGAHPLSPAWKRQATADPAVIGTWWNERPHASILLVTGRSFDVLDIPAAAGLAAVRRLERDGIRSGPVAVSAMERTLFFVATRAADGDEDEWWSCHLDCEPELLPEVTGLRWHCRDSYVVAPPSRLSNGMAARWLTEPDKQPLPDALRLLEVLADACEETA